MGHTFKLKYFSNQIRAKMTQSSQILGLVAAILLTRIAPSTISPDLKR